MRFGLVSFALAGAILSGCTQSSESTTKPQKTDEKPSASQSEEAKSGGTLKVIVGSNINNIGDQPDIRSVTDFMVSNSAYETLGRYNEKGEMEPFLAEKWESDPSAKAISVVLKKGIQFHDGTEFNAEAVKWNLEHYRDGGRVEAKDIQSIDLIDNHTVKINLAQWNNSFIDNLFNFAGMMSPTAYEKNGKEGIQDNPVGTGPFTFESWDKGVSVKYKKNENYWQEGKPYLDAVEWTFMEDPMTAQASMQTGDYDVYVNTSAQVAKDLSSTLEVVKLESGMGAAGTSLAPDSDDPNSPFNDVRVRQAVGYAIDKKAITDTIFHGFSVPADQWSVPGAPTYNSNLKGTPFNPKKAKQLLEEAGYANGFKTKITFSSNPENMQMYTAIQGYLKNIGIDAELNPVDTAKWQEMSAKGGDWEGLIHSTFRVDNDLVFNLNRNMSSKGTHYLKTLFPEELEKVIEEASALPTFEEKMKISLELQSKVFDENLVSIPIRVSMNTMVKAPNVQDDGFGKTYLSNWKPEEAWKKK
ncbi:ABC transporter substrate-binding protein [Neobacillus sp. 3P2-tot-E-2]|uniref:ABC transporter substrate-binding protein n=1 Tax=Neobacillus sp. 3P2-tot-E-2 TaxID=3132212 RepID=UPI0039A3F3DE